VIAIDRPGYGDSMYVENRQYSTTSQEINQLADHLQLSSFSVLGYSSGGPRALSCVANLAPRIASCGLISSDGPYYDMGPEVLFRIFGSDTPLSQTTNLRRTQHEFESLFSSYSGMGKADRKEIALADITHAVKQGIDKGPTQDGILESREWDIRLESVEEFARHNKVLLWHGTDDDVVGIDVAQFLIGRCPSIKSAFIEGESHSMIRRQWAKILTELIDVSHVE
jgi:pimeloyl-ACP methyl ester carboxylesterase